jgi:ubiquinone/menaquinone biosynthesis C-methylase UbiE
VIGELKRARLCPEDGKVAAYSQKAIGTDASSAAAVQDIPAAWIVHGMRNGAEWAHELYACEALDPAAAGPATDEGAEPYTLQWFLNIEEQRHGRQGRWIPRLLEFAKHSGETLLGLGNGLGTDWLQYARHGARVIVCGSSEEQITLIRRNFELRGLSGRFLHADAACLPLESSTIDVACVSTPLHETDRPQGIVDEVYRVLKPGGKVLAVIPAYYSVDFWVRFCFPWQRWFNSTARDSMRPTGLTRAELRRLFARFNEHRVHKRQLRRADIPHLWRWVPKPALERLMGRFLVLKAFKPLSAATALQMAA